MKKSIVLSLTNEELQDLYRVLIDRDAEGALRFLDRHLRKKVNQALEGGGKVMIDVPGAGIREIGGKQIGLR